MSFLKGETLTYVREVHRLTVSWKQGSFVGFGGDRSETYLVCEYSTAGGGKVQVYIGKGFQAQRQLKVSQI